MENKETNKFNKAFGAFLHSMQNGKGKTVRKYTGKVVKVMYLGCFLIGITAIYNITTSEISGDFKVYEKNENTGQTQFFRFSGKKLQPKMEVKNILSIEYHGNGSRGIDYKRHLHQLFGFQVYGGFGATVMPGGQITYKAGVSLGF